MLEYLTCVYLMFGDSDFGPDILFFSILEEKQGESVFSVTLHSARQKQSVCKTTAGRQRAVGISLKDCGKTNAFISQSHRCCATSFMWTIK